MSQMRTKIVANEPQKANVQANNFKANQGRGVGLLSIINLFFIIINL